MSDIKPKSTSEDANDSPTETPRVEEKDAPDAESVEEVSEVLATAPADDEPMIEDAEIVDRPDDTETEPSTVEEEVVATPIAPPPGPEPASRNGFVTTLLGGVAAALIGAGAVYFLRPKAAPPVIPEPIDTARLEAIETALVDLRNAPPPEPAPAPTVDLSELTDVSDRLGQLESVLGGLDTRITTLSEAGIAVATNENGPEPSAELARLRAALETLKAENDGLRAEIAQQQAENEAIRAGIDAVQTAADEEIASIRAATAAEIAAVKSQVGDVEEAARLRATRAARGKALAELVAAVETGAPFDSVLPALADGGVDVPATLAPLAATGVAKLLDLQDSFPNAAREGLAASIKANMGESAGERLTAFIRSQVGARSLGAREGNDPDAVLSRAEAALRAGQIPQALVELGALPTEGQAAMQDWIDQAQGRQTALDAISALQTALTES